MAALSFVVTGTAFHTPGRDRSEVLEDCCIGVGDDGTIASLTHAGAPDHARRKAELVKAAPVVSLERGQYLLPGLVDLHVHAPQWPQVGKALHLPLYDWLQTNTFPLESRYADTGFARRIYAGLVDDLLANGTTTALYFATIHLEATQALAEICLGKGQRALIGRVAMDDPSQCPDYYRDASAEAGISQSAAFIGFVRDLAGNADGLVRPVVTPRFIPSCSTQLLEGLGRLAADHVCHIQTHCSESDWEHGHVLDRFGKSDTASLDGFGLLSRQSILAHSNFIWEADMETIGLRQSGIAHCPLSNFYFSDAAFPLRRALDKGLHVGLGTDLSGGHSASLLDACRYAVATSRALEHGIDPRRPPETRGWPGSRTDFIEAFWLATAGGGQALDLPIGRLEPGYRFDAILVDTDIPDSAVRVFDDVDSPDDVFQKIVYTANRANIRKVWVDGKVVVDKNSRA